MNHDDFIHMAKSVDMGHRLHSQVESRFSGQVDECDFIIGVGGYLGVGESHIYTDLSGVALVHIKE